MAYTYFSTDYFSTDYFSTDYFGADDPVDGIISTTIDLIRPRATGFGYWSSNYWSADYWSNNYWDDGYLEPFIRGTFFPATGFAGIIEADLENLTTSFSSSAVQVENFDVSVYVGVVWTLTEGDTYTGSSAVTLDDVTSAALGTFVDPVGFIGSIAVTLEDHSANYDGTFVAPASRSGVISRTLDNLSANFDGEALGIETIFGTVSVTLEDYAINAEGESMSPSSAGTFAVTLDDFTSDANGNFYDSGIRVGRIQKTLQDFGCAAVGSSSGGSIVQSIKGDSKGSIRVPSGRTNRVGSGRKMRA